MPTLNRRDKCCYHISRHGSHQEVLPYLLAVHDLPGCDSVAYMYGIGKAIVLKGLHNGYLLKRLDIYSPTLLMSLQKRQLLLRHVTDAKKTDKCLTFVTVHGFQEPDANKQHLLPS